MELIDATDVTASLIALFCTPSPQPDPVESVQRLLDLGVDPSLQLSVDHKETPLIIAAGNGHVDTVRLLLDRNVDPNQSTMDAEGGVCTLYCLTRWMCRHCGAPTGSQCTPK
eukprot:m.297065 g.297065  ORF g.297065 m.297065 type:complete len:112 (+) comp270394_c0_seq1:85-420(+)